MDNLRSSYCQWCFYHLDYCLSLNVKILKKVFLYSFGGWQILIYSIIQFREQTTTSTTSLKLYALWLVKMPSHWSICHLIGVQSSELSILWEWVAFYLESRIHLLLSSRNINLFQIQLTSVTNSLRTLQHLLNQFNSINSI